MSPNPRQLKLLEEVRVRGAVSVERLAERLGVTLQTVRRDVQRLAEAGLLARFHGGVSMPAARPSASEEWRKRQALRADAKHRIAQAVVAAIPDGSALMLGVGTTVEAVARELLRRRRLSVVTHSLHVAAVLADHPDGRVLVAGGLLRARDRGAEGEATEAFLRSFKVDIALFSAIGLDADGTIRDQDLRDQKAVQAMMAQARETWLLADSSKFHRAALVASHRLEQVQHLFTDAPPPPPFPQLLSQAGVPWTVAADAPPACSPAAAPRGAAGRTQAPADGAGDVVVSGGPAAGGR
ncbi:MAG: DeoR/GlpR family DNA-binding transcription regulator [Pseudomonadota bacterium]